MYIFLLDYNITAFMNEACYQFIDFMKIMTFTWGASYGTLNTLLFAILGPLAVICGFIATLTSYLSKRKTSKIFLWTAFGAWCIIVFMLFTTFIDILFPQLGLPNEIVSYPGNYVDCYAGTGFLDKICYRAIDFLSAMSKCLGISYGVVNIILYVIIGPISTVCYIASSLLSYFNKKFILITSRVLFVIGSILVGIAVLMIFVTLVYLVK